MKVSLILVSGLVIGVSSHAMEQARVMQPVENRGVDTLHNLCVKKLEQKGVEHFSEELRNLDEHQAFKALCFSLLNSNSFTVEQKLKLLDKMQDGSALSDDDDVNFADSEDESNRSEISNMSDIEMGSSFGSITSTGTMIVDNSSHFITHCYKDMVKLLASFFGKRETPTINSIGFDDRTLLHAAVYGSKFSYFNPRTLVRMLLSLGASCTARDIHGNTALHDAVSILNVGIVQDILESINGLHAVHIGDAKNQTPLHIVLEECKKNPNLFQQAVQIVRLLRGAGADIAVHDNMGRDTSIKHCPSN